jgi:hypothetical protein
MNNRNVKKIILVVIFSTLFGLISVPLVLAQRVEPPQDIRQCTMRHEIPRSFIGFICPWGPNPADRVCPYENAAGWTCGSCCILDTIYTISDWVFYIVLAFAIIFIALGAFYIMTGGGEPERVSTGRRYIMYAIIGLIVGLLARSVPAIARAIIGA